VQAKVTNQLQLSASVGTVDSNIRKSTLFPATVGNHTPKTVPWTLNLAAQYTTPIANDLNFVARADFKHNARKYWQIDNVDVQRPINIVNLRAGVDGKHWSLYGFGRNIFNVRYYTDYNPGNFSGSPYDTGFLAQPATYGVEAKVKF
jgi:iron complex outermembrane receptor protein